MSITLHSVLMLLAVTFALLAAFGGPAWRILAWRIDPLALAFFLYLLDCLLYECQVVHG